MRIISGSARGRKLKEPQGMDTRPTTDKVKESLFNIIQFDLEGRRVLDLFGGTGQLGLEALSRGSAHCTFVEQRREAVALIRENLKRTGFSDRARVVQGEALSFLASCRERFDLVFLDPPYRTGLLQRALPLVEQHMNPGGTILCEHPLGEEMPEVVGSFVQYRSHKYGKIQVTLYRRQAEEGREQE